MRIPQLFRNVPSQLRIVDPPATSDELAEAHASREPFMMDEYPDPYMVDIVRAFRLVRGSVVYLEVGTRDKGNVAWASTLLASNAVIIDVDIESFPKQEVLLRSAVNHGQKYHSVVGDSVAEATLAQITTALDGRLVDVIFCDSSHMYEHTLAEFDLYFPLLRPGGILMYHDCFWEGNGAHKGKAQALEQINCFQAVFAIFMNEPVHRFLPRSTKSDVWGGVGIIPKI